MQTNESVLRNTQELELEIERHCAGLGLNCSDKYQVQQFTHEIMQNMQLLKDAASKGDRTAGAKVELFGMAMLMHDANIKAYGPDYFSHLGTLEKSESAWVVIAKALWSELESRNLDNE